MSEAKHGLLAAQQRPTSGCATLNKKSGSFTMPSLCAPLLSKTRRFPRAGELATGALVRDVAVSPMPRSERNRARLYDQAAGRSDLNPGVPIVFYTLSPTVRQQRAQRSLAGPYV